MFDKIKDHPILVLLSMLVGAFLAGISALIFIQQQVDVGVQQQLRLQKPAFIKEISDALANGIPKPIPLPPDRKLNVTYKTDPEETTVRPGEDTSIHFNCGEGEEVASCSWECTNQCGEMIIEEITSPGKGRCRIKIANGNPNFPMKVREGGIYVSLK